MFVAHIVISLGKLFSRLEHNVQVGNFLIFLSFHTVLDASY